MTYLITAIGSMSTEAIITSIRASSKARVIGCNSHPAEWTATSPMVDSFHRVPTAKDPPAYLDHILEICKSEQVRYVIPLTDVEVDVLTLHRDVFASIGVTLCIPSDKSVQICRDKWLMHKLFQLSARVFTIPTFDPENIDPKTTSLPLMAKPRRGRSSEGQIKLNSQEDLKHYQRTLTCADYIVQPFLEGSIYVVDIVRQKQTGRVASMSRQELLRTQNGAGLTVRMIHSEDLDEICREIVETLDINGCVNVEFLVHDNVPLLMDINPRFSAGVVFSKLSGYDMAVNHLRCFGGPPIDAPIVPPPLIHARRYVETTTTISHK